jgi:hypothetical protein
MRPGEQLLQPMSDDTAHTSLIGCNIQILGCPEHQRLHTNCDAGLIRFGDANRLSDTSDIADHVEPLTDISLADREILKEKIDIRRSFNIVSLRKGVLQSKNPRLGRV